MTVTVTVTVTVTLTQVRERLYARKSRPADLFRAWDRDGDGLLGFDELMAGIRAFGLEVHRPPQP